MIKKPSPKHMFFTFTNFLFCNASTDKSAKIWPNTWARFWVPKWDPYSAPNKILFGTPNGAVLGFQMGPIWNQNGAQQAAQIGLIWKPKTGSKSGAQNWAQHGAHFWGHILVYLSVGTLRNKQYIGGDSCCCSLRRAQ